MTNFTSRLGNARDGQTGCVTPRKARGTVTDNHSYAKALSELSILFSMQDEH